jgi:hypothetical protein
MPITSPYSGTAAGLTDVDQTTQAAGKVLTNTTSGGKAFSWQTPLAATTPAWTPADVSGASLALTINSSSVYQIGKLVYIELDVTYPVTVDGSAAQISLPVTCIAKRCALAIGRNSTATLLGAEANGSSITFPGFTNAGGGGNANVTLSTGRLSISGVYQAA